MYYKDVPKKEPVEIFSADYKLEWFGLTKKSITIKILNAGSFLTGFFDFLKIPFAILPSIVFDILTSGSIYIIWHLSKWIFNILKSLIKKIFAAIIEGVTKWIRKIAVILSLVLIILSLVFYLPIWKLYTGELIDFISSLL